ncbi:MAG: lipopolysaccharide heptosyltransferase II [Desulfarculaceae bacterium]|jgi:heptosyltransferase-2
MPRLDPRTPERILVRGTNWVGDAVMTLPALAALAQACPQAEIEVLAKPWVSPVYEAAPQISRVHILDRQGRHRGIRGLLRLAAELKGSYDWAVLMQNAFQAGLIAWLARVPVRLGYASDGRRTLLSHPVPMPADKGRMHETSYYLGILQGAGLLSANPPLGGVQPQMKLPPEYRQWAEEFLSGQGGPQRLLGLAPGAAYGPAKCWPAERFAATARQLAGQGLHKVLIFGSKQEAAACAEVYQGLEGLEVINLAGQTSLGQALGLLEQLDLFITNDSGLMHAAAALGTPTVAVFGSTNPVTTGPLGPWVRVVRQEVNCSPCLKPRCPLDLRCFTAITPEEVTGAAVSLLEQAQAEAEV